MIEDMIKKLQIIITILLFSACTKPIILPVSPPLNEFTLNKPRKEVFDAALTVATEMNLSVGVLEKDSGFIRFDRAELTAEQLDVYCHYPFIHPKTLKPWSTFSRGHLKQRREKDTGYVSGNVSLTLLLNESGTKDTKATLRANFVSANSIRRWECGSTGQLENEFKTKLESRILGSK